MIDITGLRKEFTVFVIERDPTMAISLVETLKSVGYQQARFYPTLASAQSMIQSEAPHVLVIDHDGFEATLDKFLVDVKATSPETLTILAASSRKFLDSLQCVSRTLAYDTISRPFATTLELVQKVDRACQFLYYQFEGEQLREQIEGEGDLAPQKFVSQPTNTTTAGIEAMDGALEKLSQTKDLEQTVQIFVDALSRSLRNAPIAFFRYVPAHMSLLFAQSAWLPNEKFRGIGLDLKKEDPSQISYVVEGPGEMPSLRALVRDVFNKEKFTAFSHVSDGEALGVFVILDQVNLEENMQVNILRRAFELAYKRNLTIKEKHLLDLTDPLTGLANRKQFLSRLEQEMARSRRILMPVSLITMDVDGFSALNSRLGTQQADSVLKTVAMILKRTTRLNDILARVGPDEFACLLPHTGHEGAAIKAERLRILLESTKVPLLEGLGLGPIRVSCGVSEYPSFCGDGEGLIQSADEAMVQVRKAGGNRVCLAAAPIGFKMDFTPRLAEDSSKFAAKGAR